MKFLLIAPREKHHGTYDSPPNTYNANIGDFEMMPSTAVVTVAALAPADFEVRLCNESTQAIDFDADVDVVGITANVSQTQRALEIAAAFRERGRTVVMGGAHVSLAPALFEDHCDSMVIGELEGIAEAFFSDMRERRLRPRYHGPTIGLETSPIPRWDLYPHDRVVSGVVQTSRGCPFNCTFCDVIQYLGRNQRHKRNRQIIDELQNLYDLGFSSVFIADDNFTANKKMAKSILAEITDWNGADGRGFVTFQTQMSINMTKHDDLLAACHGAGLLTNFVGIETSDPIALEECDKRSNQNLDLVQQCEKSVRAGVMIEPALIVGFDSDDRSAFDRQFRFVMSLPAGSTRVGPLIAPVATPLYDDMRTQGRLIGGPDMLADAAPNYISNFTPAQMSRADLYIGLRWLISNIYDPDNFLVRLERMAELLAPPPWVAQGKTCRSPRPLGVKLAARILRESSRVDARVAQLLDHAEMLASKHAEIKDEINDVTFRYLAIFTNLATNGMYDVGWAKLPEAPFDGRFIDRRLERIKSLDGRAATAP